MARVGSVAGAPSAEQTLTQARELVGPALRTSVDEALTEVFAMSGQVDRAIETGRMLLARLGVEHLLVSARPTTSQISRFCRGRWPSRLPNTTPSRS